MWCFSPDAENVDYMSFYPGDEYVDWWAIDIFELSKLEEPCTIQFLGDAVEKGYPIMLGEVTSRYVGTQDGLESCNKFYGPFFQWMNDHEEIKAFCYINWQWNLHARWSDWGDARIEENEEVRSFYQQQLLLDRYIHSIGAQP